MGQERPPIIGDDGELLSNFSALAHQTSEPARLIGENQSKLVELQGDRQIKLLSLMHHWENKRPEGGLAKEFVAVGKGDDRVVFCTNPLIEKENKLQVSYLSLSKYGFFTMQFYSLNEIAESTISSELIGYVNSPFAIGENGINIDRDNTDLSGMLRELYIFHSHLRGEKPGNQVRLKHSYEYGVLEVYSLESKVGRSTFGERLLFNFSGDPIGYEAAEIMFSKIQNIVTEKCDTRLDEIEDAMHKNTEEIDTLNRFLPAEGKRKRFWNKK